MSMGEGQIFLQQAETVRLVSIPYPGKFGEFLATPVTSLKLQDLIYVLVQSRGTHVGRKIDSDVVEK